MPLTLFHSPMTRSVRLLWLLEEMAVPYELKTMPYDSEYFDSDEYHGIIPMGKVPALYDGDQLILESTAIMEYLLGRYGPSCLAVPVEDTEHGPYLQWLHMAESGVAHYLAVVLGNSTNLPKYQVSEEFERYCRYQVEKC